MEATSAVADPDHCRRAGRRLGVLIGTPAFDRALLAMSHELEKTALPIGSNCRAQSAGSATTVTG
jgi:hypothetical protein